MRGGQNEYKINDVLGQNFVQFVGLLKNGKLSDFTFANYGELTTSTSATAANQPKPTDIHYDFSEFLMAATAAFRQLEEPDVKKIGIAGQYADQVSNMYDELVSGKATSGFVSPETSKFNFKQLPFHEHGNLKYLLPGFNLLPYTDTVYTTVKISEIALAKAIRYMYHVIALLDLTALDVRDVMLLLRADNVYFIPFVDNIIDTLTNSVYYAKQSPLPDTPDTLSLLRNGVIGALTTIAVQIINTFKNLPVSTGVLPVDYTNTVNDTFTDQNKFKPYLQKVGVDVPASVNNIASALTKINDAFFESNVNAATAVPDADQLKAYIRNALYNPVYLDNNLVISDLDPASNEYNEVKPLFEELKLQKGGLRRRNNKEDNSYKNWDNNSRYDEMTGGKGKGKGMPNKNIGVIGVIGGNKIPSFPFLYGPASTLDNHLRLVTDPSQGSQGANAEIVNYDSVKTIYEFNKDSGIVKELVAYGTPNNNNGSRVVVLGILNALISKQLGIDHVPNTEIETEIGKALRAYTTVYTRIRNIPTDITSLIKTSAYRDQFVSEFTRQTYKSLSIDANNKLVKAAASLADANKPKLDKDYIWSFYSEVAVKNPSFYQEFFNLVRLQNTSVSNNQGYEDEAPFTEALNARPDERQFYRFNVKKSVGYTRLRNLQYGGAARYGDIVLITLVPDYPTDGSVTGIWLSSTVRIDDAALRATAPESVRIIVRSVYNTAAGTQQVTVYNTTIDLTNLATRVGTTGLFLRNFPALFNNFLRGLSRGTQPKSTWKEGELLISEHMLKEGNTWERDGEVFVKRGKDGNVETVEPQDNCAFIDDTRKCLDFLQFCLPATDQASYETNCRRLLDFNFKFNPSITELKKQVQKINPQVAFAILNQFHFGSYTDTETREPVPGFHRYKVQSVGSWLEELMTGVPVDRCQRPIAIGAAANADAFKCGSLREQLGALANTIIAMASDPDKHNFFTYLDVLVHWVNANQQVLNREELTAPEYSGVYPDINKSYKTYSYFNPYRPAEIRLRGVACGLERLKSNIMNELSGAKASTTISSIASVPLGIEMPLSRQGFMSPLPFGGLVPMLGGAGIFETEMQMNNLNQPYGFVLFEDIYKDLLHTMGNLVGPKRVKLTENTRNKIETKLHTFKEAEQALMKSLKNLIERNKLYQASRGHVNSYVDDQGQYAAILSKHSNLLNLSSAYNKKAVNLVDLFQTIANAILTKIETPAASGATSGSAYQRPMTMDYHYTAGKKN
jgi:hypothetical protein